LEIINTSAASISLDQWTLRGDVDLYFNPAASLAAGQMAILVAFDPILDPGQAASFRASYGVAATTTLFGPWQPSATLSDTAGEIRLNRRVPAPPDDPAFIGLMLEDEVIYQNTSPWPSGVSGTGLAIHRLGSRRWGNDPTAWASDVPSPGRDAGGFSEWQSRYFAEAGPDSEPGGDPDRDGLPNLIEYLLGRDPTSGSPLVSTIIEATEDQPAKLVLDYTRRLDRTDYLLRAEQAAELLESWLPAANDEVSGTDGLLESRRVWLPISGSGGFLRLHAQQAPSS
jgi:hypothetical protein